MLSDPNVWCLGNQSWEVFYFFENLQKIMNLIEWFVTFELSCQTFLLVYQQWKGLYRPSGLGLGLHWSLLQHYYMQVSVLDLDYQVPTTMLHVVRTCHNHIGVWVLCSTNIHHKGDQGVWAKIDFLKDRFWSFHKRPIYMYMYVHVKLKGLDALLFERARVPRHFLIGKEQPMRKL